MSEDIDRPDLQRALRQLTDQYLTALIRQASDDYAMGLWSVSTTPGLPGPEPVDAIRGLPGSPPGVRYSILWGAGEVQLYQVKDEETSAGTYTYWSSMLNANEERRLARHLERLWQDRVERWRRERKL